MANRRIRALPRPAAVARLREAPPDPRLAIIEETVESVQAAEIARRPSPQSAARGLEVPGARRLAIEGGFQSLAQGLGEEIGRAHV